MTKNYNRNKYNCIKCGAPTMSDNTLCMKCPTFDVNNISQRIFDQFVGFLMGEGSIKIGFQRGTQGHVTTNASIVIALRYDDAAVLKRFIEFFNGVGSYDFYEQKDAVIKRQPQFRWTITRASDIYSILTRIDKEKILPFKKMNDVKIGIEWCQWRLSVGRKGYDPAPGIALMERMRKIHGYYS